MTHDEAIRRGRLGSAARAAAGRQAIGTERARELGRLGAAARRRAGTIGEDGRRGGLATAASRRQTGSWNWTSDGAKERGRRGGLASVESRRRAGTLTLSPQRARAMSALGAAARWGRRAAGDGKDDPCL